VLLNVAALLEEFDLCLVDFEFSHGPFPLRQEALSEVRGIIFAPQGMGKKHVQVAGGIARGRRWARAGLKAMSNEKGQTWYRIADSVSSLSFFVASNDSNGR